jgi:hypothetical protein
MALLVVVVVVEEEEEEEEVIAFSRKSFSILFIVFETGGV